MMMKINFPHKILKNLWLQRLLRLVIGGLFIYAGFVKIIQPDKFAEQIMNYEMVPWPLVNFFAVWLLCFEILIGVLIIGGMWLRVCSMLLSGLVILFIIAIFSALARGISLHCGCFSLSSTGPLRTWLSLWQEGLILLGCVWLWATTKKA